MRGAHRCKWTIACVLLFPGVAASAQDACERLSGAKIPIFDVPAAEKWCAENRPKCD